MSVEMGPTPVQMEAMRLQVTREIEEQGTDLPHFLGNLRNWLRPKTADNPTNYRSLLRSLGRLRRVVLRRPHAERLPEGERIEEHSERWLGENDMQFLFDVNAAMSRQGINPEKIQQLDEYAAEHPADYEIVQLRLAEHILPVYLDLRVQGYKHQELTA